MRCSCNEAGSQENWWRCVAPLLSYSIIQLLEILFLMFLCNNDLSAFISIYFSTDSVLFEFVVVVALGLYQ